MNILITGGTGFIGSALQKELLNDGHNVVITTRRRESVWYEDRGVLKWGPPALIPSDIISNIDAVINLAGEPIASGRWTDEKKERIRQSRVDTTRAIVQSMRNVNKPPQTLISASAIGYYGPHGDEDVTEETPPGSDFLAEVCKAWEVEAMKAGDAGIRVVIIRLGTVLGAQGGALPRMLMPFRFFLGGPIGSGKQWFSWIHQDDVVGIIKYILEDKTISGAVNLTSPHPVTNREFCSALGRVLHRPCWMPVPAFVLKTVFGELAEMLLTGQRVIPKRLLKAGYEFRYQEIQEALKAIIPLLLKTL